MTDTPSYPENSPALHVYSETGRLRRAVVHSPGQELQNITPRHIGRVWMDDVLYLREAQADHQELLAVMAHAGVELHQFRDLLRESLTMLDAPQRDSFLDELQMQEGFDAGFRRELAALDAPVLVQVCFEGMLPQPSLTQFITHDAYRLTPLPNALFVRDPLLIVGNFYLRGRMRHPIRAREGLLWSWITQHHPFFSHSPFADLRHTLREAFTQAGVAFENGNVLLLAPDTLLIGCNERTDSAAIDLLAEHLLHRETGIKRILVGIFSAEKPYHGHYLDTGICLLHQAVDALEILLHAPMLAPAGANITWLMLTSGDGECMTLPIPSLTAALAQVPSLQATPPQFTFCGSQHRHGVKARIMQEREWHYQACNALPLAPGKLIFFRRNTHTLAALAEKGYALLSAAEFLALSPVEVEERLSDPHHRLIITVRDQEIARAHGGPRSLVLPLHRDHPTK